MVQALGKNMSSCKSYLERVKQAIKGQACSSQSSPQSCSPGQQQQQPTPSALSGASAIFPAVPSAMQAEAESFFMAVFLWNDVLCSAVERRPACAADDHRRFLTNAAFSSTFEHVTGCEAWIMLAIMDITALEVHKDEQLAHGSLSLRGLINQANKMEERIDGQIARLSKLCPSKTHVDVEPAASTHHIIQSLIFGHAVLTFLNTVVSGALSGVPEIHESIQRAIPAWEMVPRTMDTRHLAWAYSTSACLATGSQREVFRDVAAQNLRVFRDGVEECWIQTDRRGSVQNNAACDWRDICRKLNAHILFV